MGVVTKMRPEWQDVTPVPQDDGPDPVVPIRYSADFTETMGYFRAVLQSTELSERAYQLTFDVINLNAGNYTAWHFRRMCIEALRKDLVAELDWVGEMAADNPKNYQLWHHRRAIAERLGGDGRDELRFTAEMLAQDSKNYHGWSHRQWAIRHFNLWAGELEFIDDMLLVDIRNNSAWNQRHFVVKNTEELTDEVREREIRFALEALRKAPHNQSPYNYLNAYARGADRAFCAFPFVRDEIEQLIKIHPHCAPLLGLFVDVLESHAIEEGETAARIQAAELCNKLITTVDVIRKKFWSIRQAQLTRA